MTCKRIWNSYSEPLTCCFGQVDSSKRCIEVKIQLSEVS